MGARRLLAHELARARAGGAAREIPADIRRHMVVPFGSSTMAYGHDVLMTGGARRINQTARGPVTVASALADQRIIQMRNMATAGHASDDTLARVAEVIAMNPGRVALHVGTNDVFQQGLLASTALANIRQICDALLDNDIAVDLFVPQKWQTTDAVFTTAKLAQYMALADGLHSYAYSKAGVELIDGRAGTVDQASATADQLANAYIDTKHYSNLGTLLGPGPAYADVLRRVLPNLPLPLAETTNHLPDPGMTATGGTLGAGITGTAWQHFAIERGAGTPTAVCSIVPAPDGRGFAQRIAATAAAANDRINVKLANSLVLPLVSTGERVVFEMKCRIESGAVGLRAALIYLFANAGAYAVTDMGRDTVLPANDKAYPGTQIDFTFRTPAWDVVAGTTSLEAIFSALWVAAGSANITLWQPRIRKVPSLPLIYTP